MTEKILRILFPPKCVLCKTILSDGQTDLCHSCRQNAPEFTKSNFKISFVAGWTGLWYYKDNVRQSLIRYKFWGKRHYAETYGRLLAMKLHNSAPNSFDLLTWVPISFLRRLGRGYDQVELLAHAVGRELGTQPVRLLKKIRNTPPQSGIGNAARRRANVLNAYKAVNVQHLQGKRVLLLDDILTTGATASECAKVLRTAGAAEVTLAVLAVAKHDC